MIKILKEPKNSLTKQYQELFKLDGVKLSFKDNALKEIAQKAISKKTGAKYLSLQIKEPYKKGDAPQQGASQSEDPDLGF